MAAAQLVIDSDIIVDYLRRYNQVLEQALGQFDCALSAVTVYELEIGLVNAPRQAALFNDLIDIVTVLPMDRQAARAAAQVHHQLRNQGLTIGVPDTLIAGTCLAQGLPLLTRNVQHYGQVPDLVLIEIHQLP